MVWRLGREKMLAQGPIWHLLAHNLLACRQGLAACDSNKK